jgi:glycosidase
MKRGEAKGAKTRESVNEVIKIMAPKRLADLKLGAVEAPPKGYRQSPRAWEDQVLYFLLVDRFSDGNEKGYKDADGNVVATGATPMFKPADKLNAVSTEEDARAWREAGGRYVHGKLKGLTSKIGYLKRLGVTAIWVSPVFKQVKFEQSYHGYGIQDFLEVNPEFGSADDLKELVRVAHEHDIYVILDIILNHTGNIFSYEEQNGSTDPPWDGSTHPVKGFNDETGKPTIPFRRTDPEARQSWPSADSAVWPVEFQNPDYYTQRGHITNWDAEPEFFQGDFFSLKDVNQGVGGVGDYHPSAALIDLCKVYKYWIALADLDGYRLDTAKHMERGAVRFFASEIHEFAQSIGKDNFYIMGEILGGRQNAFETVEVTGLDAALGIEDIPDKLEYLVKGFRDPEQYFNLFRNSAELGKETHAWFKNKVVTVFDDHDQVRKGENKARFCADPGAEKTVLNVLALNVCTLGIPCIYYGSEQGFDGHGSGNGADRYIREAMFGGEFGAFATHGVHFFDEDNPIYRALAEILEIRRHNIVLSRGRQYLREISGDGEHFGYPRMIGGQLRSVVAWSRLLSDREVLLAINTDADQPRSAWVTLDSSLHAEGQRLTCLYSTDPAQSGATTEVARRNGMAASLTVPAAGFVIFE